jgi:phosphosulfolactate phosphohydrolase-like enzyme
MWRNAKPDIFHYLADSEHVARLVMQYLERDIAFCLNIDTTKVLPIYDKNLIINIL